MSSNTFSISFFIKKVKIDKNGEAPIYGRITINGERAEFSTSRKVKVERWDSGKVKGKTIPLKATQNHLDTLRTKVYSLHTELINESKPISAKIIKNRIQVKHKKGKSLIEAFLYYEKKLFELNQKSTYKKYVTIHRHIEQFIKLQYKKSDIQLKELDHQFITDFVHYLKTSCGISHNTARRYMKQLKRIIQIAEDNDWIEKNPFKKFRMSEKPINRIFLTETELKMIEEKEIGNQRLNEVKDVFLFCCYTGLSYVDVEKLTLDEIQNLDDGKQMIITRRTKSEVKAEIYLFPKALAIIEKYKTHPICERTGKLLPVKSNQKYNAYLKEVQVICDIKKSLTSHVARRTYGTYLLNNNIRIEIVQRSLGHKKIEQTQIYAKLLNQTIADEVSKLDDKI